MAQTGAVSVSFFRQARTIPLLPNGPPVSGGANIDRLYLRVMQFLGSRSKQANFVICQRDINLVKGKLMQGDDAVEEDDMIEQAKSMSTLEELLLSLRTAIGVIRYLHSTGTPNINQRLTNIVNDIGVQWHYGQETWNAANPNDQIEIAEFWSEWSKEFFVWVIVHTQDFVTRGIAQMRRYWGPSSSILSDQVLSILDALEGQLDDLSIDTSGFN